MSGVHRPPPQTFTLGFAVLLGALFAIAAVLLAAYVVEPYPIVNAAIGGGLIGFGLGLLCWWLERGRY